MTTVLKDSGTQTFQDTEVENLTINGNVILSDDDFIQFGAGNDMQIGHDPEINFVKHAKQVQFLSSMTSGDTLKFRETQRRNSTFTFASAKDDDVERSNCYISTGNETYDGVANVPYMQLRVRSQDNASSVVNPIELYQPGQTSASAKILLNSDTYIPDARSLFIGDSKDFQITHSTNSFIDEQGSGSLFLRTNGDQIAISDTTSSTNYMARFIKDNSVELYHNKMKKFETTSTGITITGSIDNTSTLVALADGWDNASSITSSQFLSNSFVRSTFLVDLGLEGVSVENNQVIGTVHGDPNYITQMTNATVGLIYKVEFICVEAPVGGITNIDVSYSSTSLTKGGTTGITKIVDGGAHSPNMTFNQATGSTLGTNLTDKYLYLTAGGSGNTTAYSAGKFLIILYGYKL